MELDKAVFEEIQRGGAGSAKEIGERLSSRVYDALQRLVKAEKIDKAGYKGQGNEKIYSLPATAPLARRI